MNYILLIIIFFLKNNKSNKREFIKRMSLYTIITLLMSVSIFLIYETNAIVTLNNRRSHLDKVCYTGFWLILLIMVMLCDDRSPDYRAYKVIFGFSPSGIDFSSFYYSSQLHTEIGWKFLGNIFKTMGISFEWFIAIVCGFSFLMLNKFIVNYCNENKSLSLFWLYGSFCLAYYYIGLRMGLAISIFLGILLPLLEKKKYIKYFLGVLICTTFHTVSILYALLIFVEKIDLNKIKKMLIICVAIGIGVMITGTNDIIYMFIPTSVTSSLGYGLSVSENYPLYQLIYRLLFLLVSLYCYYMMEGEGKPEMEVSYKCYFAGMMFYLIFSSVPILGTRVFDMVKPLETIFVCKAIGSRKRKFLSGRLLFLVSLLLCLFMVFYHINAIKGYFIETSNYSFYSFPFRSIIDR